MSQVVVNTHEAKSRLSELLRMVEAGDDVMVARNGEVVAKLIKWPTSRSVRSPGALRGTVSYGADVVDSDPEVLSMFQDIDL
jgi:prevent-host-death family protein